MSQHSRRASTTDRLTTLLSYGALLLILYLVYLILAPFLVPLAWSAVLAIFFYPLYEQMRHRFGDTRGALISTLAVTFLLIVPVLLILIYAAREALNASAMIQTLVASGTNAVHSGSLDRIRHRLPESVSNFDLFTPLRQGAQRVAAYLAGSVGSLLKDVFSFVVNLLIVLLALFFVFRDSEGILRDLRYLIPFEKDLQDSMLSESRDLIFASVAVALLIAAIQGVLGGIAFAITGIPAAVFFGVLIAFTSIIPVVGSWLVWIPAVIWLLIAGHWGKALVIIALSGVVAGTADNLVRPLLLSNRTRLNDLLLFISILGGMSVFGLLGLVAGPTILAAGLGIFRAYVEQREREAVEELPV